MAALDGLFIGADVHVHWVKFQCLTKSGLREEAPRRLRDLILIHDSRQNVSPGILHIGESAAA
jgi:hypothetical protein